MKAIVADKYGSPDGVPELKIIDEPVVTGYERLNSPPGSVEAMQGSLHAPPC